MKTTIDLPEKILQGAQVQAARLGLDLNEFIAAAVAREIDAVPARKASGQSRPRSKLPTVKTRGTGTIANVSAALQAQIENEEDLARYNRSFGR